MLAAPAETGPIPLPSARDLRLRLSAVCRPDPDLAYFGSQETRRGAPVFIQTRAHSQDESGLFALQLPTEQLNAYMLQPDPTPMAIWRPSRQPTDVKMKPSGTWRSASPPSSISV